MGNIFFDKKISRNCGHSVSGFTLIELLVVISIISVLSTVALTSTDAARRKARDVRRLAEMDQIKLALEMYKNDHGYYPPPVSSNGDWEISNEDGNDFIDALKDEGYMPSGVPVDPTNSSGRFYYYYRYGAGDSGCATAKGNFYVLGITDMETSVRPYPGSPGWNCDPAQRNWQNEFDWVTGSFTYD